ncbi:hypothetical protein GJAV_G00101120 [Gymnothorax javanicus]|nr:hypothetical protein GJAV_G00101120 [Gymnothorax javanicus]
MFCGICTMVESIKLKFPVTGVLVHCNFLLWRQCSCGGSVFFVLYSRGRGCLVLKVIEQTEYGTEVNTTGTYFNVESCGFFMYTNTVKM